MIAEGFMMFSSGVIFGVLIMFILSLVLTANSYYDDDDDDDAGYA